MLLRVHLNLHRLPPPRPHSPPALQVLAENRVIKSAGEVEVMRYAAQAAARAHVAVMQVGGGLPGWALPGWLGACRGTACLRATACRAPTAAPGFHAARRSFRCRCVAHPPPQAVKPGQYEFQAESLYLHTIYAGAGCRTPHYTPILASGPNAGAAA